MCSWQVRPRISGILRILLHKQEPLDAEQEFIKRAEVYPPPSSTLVPQGREDVLGWDQLVEASSKGGRMGAALPGPIRPAFQQFVRLSGQLAGEEGAVDGTTSTLYYLLTTASTGDGKRWVYQSNTSICTSCMSLMIFVCPMTGLVTV